MNGKRWIALGITVVLIIVSLGFNLVSSLAFGGWKEEINSSDQFAETVIEEGSGLNKIAVLNVEGVIQDNGANTSFLPQAGYNHDVFLKRLEHAGDDNSVKGIILRLNTPGGGVVESEEIYDEILELKEKTDKPIYVSMGSMTASAGYYISAPVDKIYASPSTITGSIGVIMQSMNYSELAEKVGVKWETIKSGPHKDIMSPNREMTEEERDILQSMIDNSYDEFVRVVSEGRDMDESKVRELADGRIYDGRQAKDVDLVDDLGNLEDTFEAMKKDLGDSNLQVIQYKQNLGFNSLFEMTAAKLMGPDKDLLGIQQLLSTPQSPKLMYLYSE
ncbi:signal peptide peptidase SppA [Pseudalkalibacillus hwajinpoensis]|uniref:Signal peptide peptidase SppA n=1 Tax=Guptibacillus hwajinpoensis TaxID=208199 RepID=A0A4U1MBN7_9BACL|nr:signal peptide peptidase SppA [Pseudalkalibacillus hwajinpoensis]TKD67941.1 signal peptide peptidase SppA [Pseudalkalibacillus hwajinpoensis]